VRTCPRMLKMMVGSRGNFAAGLCVVELSEF
jgi:hypothetical protein